MNHKIVVLTILIVFTIVIILSCCSKENPMIPRKYTEIDVPYLPIMISLPRHSKRREYVSQQGIKYEVLPTVVDATTLSNPTSVLSTRAFYDYHRKRNDHRTIASIGAIGCYMSHENAWKLVIERDSPQFIIEDDITISRNDWQKLASEWINQGNQSIPWLFFIGHASVKSVSYGTHAYILNPAAARELLAHARPIEIQVDMYMHSLFYQHNWKIEFATPTAFKQVETSHGDFKSTTQQNTLSLPPNKYLF
mgnify:CR=1 FL=1|tara:strand:+ start:8 stop:760 length:753 start_codon:yes stop_codon:yes gene_type:complete